jgi:hypothetical protein
MPTERRPCPSLERNLVVSCARRIRLPRHPHHHHHRLLLVDAYAEFAASKCGSPPLSHTRSTRTSICTVSCVNAAGAKNASYPEANRGVPRGHRQRGIPTLPVGRQRPQPYSVAAARQRCDADRQHRISDSRAVLDSRCAPFWRPNKFIFAEEHADTEGEGDGTVPITFGGTLGGREGDRDRALY